MWHQLQQIQDKHMLHHILLKALQISYNHHTLRKNGIDGEHLLLQVLFPQVVVIGQLLYLYQNQQRLLQINIIAWPMQPLLVLQNHFLKCIL
jgi:hypothetical protein